MVVHEPNKFQARETVNQINPKRSLLKRRDDLNKKSQTNLHSEIDEIAPWGGLANGS